ncbi:hypothetical protein CRYUN_Cryun37aG0135500 [Craigia yunnanensis]
MPIANVIRIMRKILPPHAKISDDAKETIKECASECISSITGEANERCQLYLHHYRELEGERGSIRGEPLVKRAVDYGTLDVAAFAPAFHMVVSTYLWVSSQVHMEP